MSLRSIRIGIDASNIRRGGGLTHLIEVLAALDPAAHGIAEVIVWGGTVTLEALPARPWLRPAYDPVLDGSALQRTRWQRTRLSEVAREQACDVLFIPGGSFGGSFRPYVTMAQNLLPFDVKERARFGLTPTRARYHVLEKTQTSAFRKSAGVIHMTHYAKGVVEGHLGGLETPGAVVYHGVNPDFDCAPRDAKPLSAYSMDAPFRWLYVSIVNLYKHQDRVAEAVAMLRQKGLPVALDLVGPAYGPALETLTATLDRFDPQRTFLQYHDAIPYTELAPTYHRADGFVFASSCETFGQILVEAMLAGLPVACSARSCMPELLGDDGLYFEPEDPASIAQALETYLRDPDLRAQKAAEGYASAQAFSWAALRPADVRLHRRRGAAGVKMVKPPLGGGSAHGSCVSALTEFPGCRDTR